jgi:hypothetical protein
MTYNKSMFEEKDLPLIDIVYGELERIATITDLNSPGIALSAPLILPIKGKCNPKKTLSRFDYELSNSINDKKYEEIQIETCPLNYFTLLALDTIFLFLVQENIEEYEFYGHTKDLRELINVEHRTTKSIQIYNTSTIEKPNQKEKSIIPILRNQYIIKFKDPKKPKTIINLMIDRYPEIEKYLSLFSVLANPEKNLDNACPCIKEALTENEFSNDYGPFTPLKLPTGKNAERILNNFDYFFTDILIKNAIEKTLPVEELCNYYEEINEFGDL